MENAKTLIYDGSFNGFLTAIFVAFEERAQIAAGIQAVDLRALHHTVEHGTGPSPLRRRAEKSCPPFIETLP